MQFFAKGKRSLVYKEGKTIVKVERPGSDARNRMENEANWLKILNAHNIGPTFLGFEKEMLRMEYIDGIPILEWVKEKNKKQKVKILKDLLRQCRVLDTLKVNKYEMHHPLKHALVRKNKIILIDFERCKRTEKPKNVTQVCQFIAQSFNCKEILKKAKKYKETYSEKEFQEIIKCLTNIT